MARLPLPGEEIRIEVLTDRIRALLAGDIKNDAGTETVSGAFHPATVSEVGAEDLVTVNLPDNAPALAPGASLILHYHDENGLYLMLSKVRESGNRSATLEVMGMAEHQRRMDERRRAKLPVRYKLSRSGEVTLQLFDWRDTFTQDISRNGLLLEAEEPIAAGDNLEIEIELLDNRIAAEGRVTRVRPGPEAGSVLAGVRFTTISRWDQEALAWFAVSG